MLSKKLLHCDVMQRARVKSKLYLPGNSNNNVALPLAPVEERSPADEQIPSAGMPRGIAAPQAVPTVREIIFNGRRFIGGRHVAAILGCNPGTLLRCHRENEDPQRTKIAGRVFYDFDKLREWLTSRLISSDEPTAV